MQTLILALVCLAGTWLNTQQQAVWKEFSSAEGRFSAAMPDDLKTTVIATETKRGKLLTHTVSSTDRDLNEYMVSWTEYGKEGIEHKATEETFNKLRDALVEFKGGKVLSESVISQEGHPAKAVTFSTSEGRVVNVRFYFVKTRFYQVMTETKAKDSEAIEKFFKSFKLLPGTLV